MPDDRNKIQELENHTEKMEGIKMKKCAFTGHRPQSLPFGLNESDERCTHLKGKLREEIIRLVDEQKVFHFITGMAIGVDMYAAEIVLELKAGCYPGIRLECAIPCEEQASKWTEKQRDRYFDIVSRCDQETLIQRHYSSDCFDRRNSYMVDQADYLIAVWNGRPSGTGKTVRYARQTGKPVIVIDPVHLHSHRENMGVPG